MTEENQRPEDIVPDKDVLAQDRPKGTPLQSDKGTTLDKLLDWKVLVLLALILASIVLIYMNNKQVEKPAVNPNGTEQVGEPHNP